MIPSVASCAPQCLAHDNHFSFSSATSISGFPDAGIMAAGTLQRLLGAEHPPKPAFFSPRRRCHTPIRQTTGGGIASRAMRSRIAANRFPVTAPSASWNITYFACHVTLAPTLISFSLSVVSAHCRSRTGCPRISASTDCQNWPTNPPLASHPLGSPRSMARIGRTPLFFEGVSQIACLSWKSGYTRILLLAVG